MIKRVGMIAGIACLLVVAVNTWAVDFTTLSNREMFELRHEAGKFSAEEKVAYEQEWKNRQEAMSEEERSAYLQQEEAEQVESGEGKKLPVVIQGQGYEKGTGSIIIYGNK